MFSTTDNATLLKVFNNFFFVIGYKHLSVQSSAVQRVDSCLSAWLTWASPTQRLAAAAWRSTSTSTPKLHAWLQFFNLSNAPSTSTLDRRVMFGFFLLLLLFSSSSPPPPRPDVSPHLVWLWAVSLAAGCLFCLLMTAACDRWTGSRTSPIDSCW